MRGDEPVLGGMIGAGGYILSIGCQGSQMPATWLSAHGGKVGSA